MGRVNQIADTESGVAGEGWRTQMGRGDRRDGAVRAHRNAAAGPTLTLVRQFRVKGVVAGVGAVRAARRTGRLQFLLGAAGPARQTEQLLDGKGRLLVLLKGPTRGGGTGGRHRARTAALGEQVESGRVWHKRRRRPEQRPDTGVGHRSVARV